MATIVVTASSLRISGGLTILRQFVSNLPLSDDKYYIFVDPGHTCVPQDNIEYIPVATRSQWARLKFDFCGFAKELKRRDRIFSSADTPACQTVEPVQGLGTQDVCV